LDRRKKGFLNAVSIGILVFLIVDVFSHAWDEAGTLAVSALSGNSPVINAAVVLIALIGGLALGLIGLVLYESRYMGKPRSLKMEIAGVTESNSSAGSTVEPPLPLGYVRNRFSHWRNLGDSWNRRIILGDLGLGK